MHYKPITLLTKIFCARQRDIKMSLRRDSNLGELDIQGVQDEIAQKKSKGKLPPKSILRQIASKSASTPVKMEQLQL